jgi:hypothetical protein
LFSPRLFIGGTAKALVSLAEFFGEDRIFLDACKKYEKHLEKGEIQEQAEAYSNWGYARAPPY